MPNKATEEASQKNYKEAAIIMGYFAVGGLLLFGAAMFPPLMRHMVTGAGFILEGTRRTQKFLKKEEIHAEDIAALHGEIKNTDTNNTSEIELTRLSGEWVSKIQKHCDAQIKTLNKMQSHLPEPTFSAENLALQMEINELREIYEAQKKALNNIIKTLPTTEKIKQIEAITKTIEKAEEKAKPAIDEVKKQLPKDAKPLCNDWVNRAKDFFQDNKKMLRFAGMVSLVTLGITLSVFTGGIAGLVGGAALGVVSFESTKTFLKSLFSKEKAPAAAHADPHAGQATAPPANQAAHAGQATHFSLTDTNKKWGESINTHCENQKNSLDKISEGIIGNGLNDVKKNLQTHTTGYGEAIKKVTEIVDNKNSSEIQKSAELKTLSRSVCKIDDAAKKEIKKTGDNLTPEAKTESKHFSERAKNFYHRNEKTILNVGRVLLAVAAVTCLVLTAGVAGAAMAVGVAAAIAAGTKAAKTVSEHLEQNAAAKAGAGHSPTHAAAAGPPAHSAAGTSAGSPIAVAQANGTPTPNPESHESRITALHKK